MLVKPTRLLPALALLLAAAMLLSACGSGGDGVDSTAAPSAAETTAPRQPGAVDTAPVPDSDKQGDAKPKPGQAEQQPVDRRPQPKKAQPRSEADAESTIPGCPPGLSDRVCRETASAKAAQESAPAQTGGRKCPDSLSREECQAVASEPKAEAPKSEPQAQPAPAACPPALSASQCAELEARYAEAAK